MSAHGWRVTAEGNLIHDSGHTVDTHGRQRSLTDLAACVRDAEAHASCVPAGPRYEDCDDPERLAAHRAGHGWGSVEAQHDEERPEWESAMSLTPTQFAMNMARGWRYRLVHPAPSTPEPPFEGAIPTGRGTWIASEGAGKVPTKWWEGRSSAGDGVWQKASEWPDAHIVEARPIPEPERTVTVTLPDWAAGALVDAHRTDSSHVGRAAALLEQALDAEDPS